VSAPIFEWTDDRELPKDPDLARAYRMFMAEAQKMFAVLNADAGIRPMARWVAITLDGRLYLAAIGGVAPASAGEVPSFTDIGFAAAAEIAIDHIVKDRTG
jgi:hypothetical protein